MESSGVPEGVEYIALSYCWGKDGKLKTKKETKRAMEQGIMTSRLPLAIFDAVMYTRALGLRYLWIDALCIIQDDEEDWRNESAIMNDIYANALLTLAAECSASVDQGFVQCTDEHGKIATQPQNRFKSLEIGDDGRNVLVQSRALPQYGYIIGYSTWSQRGWALQEEALSTRLLSFRFELQWTCQESRIRESDSFGSMLHLKFIRSTHLRTVSSPQDAFVEWQKLVLNYTERKLTDYRDKLPAISGVAKAIHQTTGSSYIAGIWADNFSADILWYSLDPKKTMNETSFIAPSFSWASVNSTTPNFDFDMGPESRYHPVAMLTWSHTVPIGNSQFGQIESGFIILKAPLLSTSLKAIDVSLESIISPYRQNISWYPETDLSAIEITDQDKTL